MPGSGETARPPVPVVRIDWRVAVGILVVGVLVFAVLSIPVAGSNPIARALGTAPVTVGEKFREQLRSHSLLWGVWFILLPIVFAVARRVQAVGLTSARGLLLHLTACVALSMVHGAIWAFIRWAFILPPGRSLPVVVGNMVSYVFASDLLRYVVFASFYHMLMFQAETRERMLNEVRLRARLAEARLEALEARLHPHFLFNTLNTISSLIRSSPRAAIGVVDDLGDLLRAALNAEPGREVSLSEELELLRRYIDIQQARFPDRLRTSVRADPDALSAFVPQMVLQPIVENAVQHGIAPREAPGTVTIEASRQGDRLRLTVRDDGVGFGQAPPRAHDGNGRGIGLTNTRARLTELYGDRFSLDIGAGERVGTIVTIELPFHTSPARATARADE